MDAAPPPRNRADFHVRKGPKIGSGSIELNSQVATCPLSWSDFTLPGKSNVVVTLKITSLFKSSLLTLGRLYFASISSVGA